MSGNQLHMTHMAGDYQNKKLHYTVVNVSILLLPWIKDCCYA